MSDEVGAVTDKATQNGWLFLFPIAVFPGRILINPKRLCPSRKVKLQYRKRAKKDEGHVDGTHLYSAG